MPDGGVAASTHWADEVVQIAPGVHHSARRLALSALADIGLQRESHTCLLSCQTCSSAKRLRRQRLPLEAALRLDVLPAQSRPGLPVYGRAPRQHRQLHAEQLRAVFLPGCNTSFALCCESSGNQQLSGPPGAGVLPATNQLTGERSELKSWGQIRELAANVNAARSIERHVLPTTSGVHCT